MAEAITQCDNESKAIRAGMEEPRSGLVDKIETLEQGIKDSWQTATETVSETMDSVKATVETTVHAVQGAVHDTTDAIGHAFDLAAHTRRHPWLMLGGAVLAGFAVQTLLGRLHR